MARPARKFILIPEYRPLHAMVECFGPKHGPLNEPCPTPIAVIGKLLKQKGDEALTIMEVKKNADGTTTDPVRLTPENYTLSYDEIVSGAEMPDPATFVTPDTPKSVAPEVVVAPGEKPNAGVANPPADDKTPDDAVVVIVQHGDTGSTNETDAMAKLTPNEESEETQDHDEDDATVTKDPVNETGDVVTAADKYANMTKAQRKQARREERALAAAQEARENAASSATANDPDDDESKG